LTFDASDLLDLMSEAVEIGAANPLARPERDITGPQLGWLKCVAPIGVWRDGNQLGKSYGQAMDCALFATDRHPYDQTHTGAKEIIVASESWAQFDPLLEKLMALLPRDEVDPKVHYVPGQGVKGYKEPVIPIIAGPGKGTLIRLKTYNQGTTKIAGTTVHRVYLDEPPPFEIYNEIRPRLNRHNGHLRISFTPTLKTGERLNWLRELIEEDRLKGSGLSRIYEHNVGLSPDAVRVLGGLASWHLVSPQAIADFIDDMLPIERDMRVNGSWTPLVGDRLLTAYSEERCVRDFMLNDGKLGPPPAAKLFVGADHGANRNKQALTLGAYLAGTKGAPPQVWIIDEKVYDEWPLAEQVARDTLDMVSSHSYLDRGIAKPLRYDDVKAWVGDRPTGKNKWGISMDNKEWKSQMQRVLAERGDVRTMYETAGRKSMAWVHSPSKHSGSMWNGFRLINSIIKRGTDEQSHWLVHPRCEAHREAYQGFNGDERNPHKDILDSARYPVEHLTHDTTWMAIHARFGR
jgi:phage terminase large subunit-like protein